jgi:hypothetical protein
MVFSPAFISFHKVNERTHIRIIVRTWNIQLTMTNYLIKMAVLFKKSNDNKEYLHFVY